ADFIAMVVFTGGWMLFGVVRSVCSAISADRALTGQKLADSVVSRCQIS
ncbi:MAG: hypothetical protein RLZZ536_3291, partial [Planctomycetota bacterium]